MFRITDVKKENPKKKKLAKRKKRRTFFSEHNFDKDHTDEEFFEIMEDE